MAANNSRFGGDAAAWARQHHALEIVRSGRPALQTALRTTLSAAPTKAVDFLRPVVFDHAGHEESVLVGWVSYDSAVTFIFDGGAGAKQRSHVAVLHANLSMCAATWRQEKAG